MNIKLSKKTFADWEKTIIVDYSANKNIHADLVKQYGKLEFDSNPKSAVVRINNESYKTSLKEINLPVGFYDLELNKPGYISNLYNVEIKNDQVIKLNISLEQKTLSGAVFRSLTFPGWGQMYQEKTITTYLYPVLFLGATAGAYASLNDYNKAVGDFNDSRKLYAESFSESELEISRKKMDNDFSKVESSEQLRNIMFMAVGAVWAWNVLDAFIVPPGWAKDYSLSARSQNGKVLAGINIKLR